MSKLWRECQYFVLDLGECRRIRIKYNTKKNLIRPNYLILFPFSHEQGLREGDECHAPDVVLGHGRILKYYNELCKVSNLCLYNNITAIPNQLQ